ncbi:MAG: Kdo hydroxylase family protein [Gammaproteobacteria bacterium]|nr:Kdo hydroxylase family protein [Gammaproteobacteria bacterium]
MTHRYNAYPGFTRTMLDTFDNERLNHLQADDISDSLERGSVVFFPQSPVPLPSAEDQAFIRQELPELLRLKNISYHPETGSIPGLGKVDAEVAERVKRILVSVSDNIATFLAKNAPRLVDNWTVGTCSFRPIQEQGRDLDPHASNELVHVDAGAYGATNGDRILRFFINVNPVEDRVWATKGNFPELLKTHGERAGLGYAKAGQGYLAKGPLDHTRTGLIKLLAAGVPMLKVLDSSPFDREMRKFHNYMKDTPSFQQETRGHEEFRFPPLSAWMVFTDMVSHACLSGQHAFVHTSIVRLENCRLPELAPLNILRQAAVSE